MPARMSRPRRPGKVRKSNTTRYLAAGVVVAAIALIVIYAYFSSTAARQTSSVTTSTSSGVLYAKLSTSMGVIEVQLFPSGAPKTVANFVNLSRSGFYNNLVWHRIVKGFVIQTGDPLTRGGAGNRSSWGTGGSPTTVPLEINSTLHNEAGYLGMARSSDPNSGSSQFYINLANNPSLDGQYTVFGKVISGMDVVNAIGNVPVNSSDQPVNPVFLTGVTISDSP